MAMNLRPTQVNFLGGELSPLLWNRFDLPQYHMGVKVALNMLVREDGTLTRRPGLIYGTGAYGNQAAYLVPFRYSNDDIYLLEFTPLAMRVVRNHAVVQTLGVDYVLTTPFTAGELPYLQSYQSGDVMWIVTGSRFTYKLTRLDHASWTLAEADIDDGPFLDANTTATTITANGTTGNVMLTASAALFDAHHVGALFRIGHVMAEQREYQAYTGTGDGDSLLCPKGATWEVRVQGYNRTAWTGITQLQVSFDSGANWQALRIMDSDGSVSTVWEPSGTNEYSQNVRLRLCVTEYTAGTIECLLYVRSHTHTGVVRIVEVVNSTHARADVLDELGATTATTDWAEGACSDHRGFWRTISFQNERLMGAGTTYQPTRIDASESGDYECFLAGTGDADAFSFLLSMPAQDAINWMAAEYGRQIVLATGAKLIELTPLDPSKGMTATNPPSIHRTLARRTSRALPVYADDAILCIGGVNNERLYEIAYSEERGGLVTRDLTAIARHVAAGGFQQLAYQQDPDSLVWARRTDGKWGALTYYYGAFAWTRHCTGTPDADGIGSDEIVSHATIPTTDGDELWCCVKRTINSATLYTLEYLGMVDVDAAIEDCKFLDCNESWDGGAAVNIAGISKASPGVVTLASWPADGAGTDITDGDNVRIVGVVGMTEVNDLVFTVATANKGALTLTLKDPTGTTDVDTSGFTTYTSGGTLQKVENTFTGATHLIGETVPCYADGVPLDDVLIGAGGAFTLDDYWNKVCVGLGYVSEVETLPIEMYLSTGLSAGRTKTLDGAVLRFHNSCGGKVGVSRTALTDIEWVRGVDDTGTAPPLKSEQITIGKKSGFTRGDLSLIVRQEEPWPMTICGIVPKVSMHA